MGATRSIKVSIAARVTTVLCVCGALLAGAIGASTATTVEVVRDRVGIADIDVGIEPEELLVRFAPGTPPTVQRRVAAGVSGVIDDRPNRGLVLIRVAASSSARALDALQRHPRVVHVEPNYLLLPTQVAPNDPSFPYQWALSNTGQAHPISGSQTFGSGTVDADIDAPEAWSVQQGSNSTSGTSPVIAILDAGVDVSHPDLAANIWVNPAEIANNRRDDDNNGYVDDVNGWDFAEDDNTLIESSTSVFGWDHGTHVAGIAAAAMNDSVGIAGVCPRCRIMVLKIMKPRDVDRDGKREMVGDGASEIEALRYAAWMGADVVNGSFGNYVLWSPLQRAAYKAAGDEGVVAVAAAGNDRGDNDLLMPFVDLDGDGTYDSASPSFPATYELPNMISVAASNDRDEYGSFTACSTAVLASKRWKCAFTNWGRTTVDVAAPGVDIYSTLPQSSYGTFDGTSMAAPHVAGIAGLVAAQHPDYTPAEVRAAILNGVDRPTSLSRLQALPGQASTGTFTVTGGRVNAATSLEASPTDLGDFGDSKIATAVRLGARVTGSVHWPSDVNDVYHKRLVAGRRYRVVLDGPRGRDLDLQIYKPGTKELWQLEAGCLQDSAGGCKVLHYDPQPDADEARRFTARVTGRYYFHVNAWVKSGGAYTLEIARA